MKENQFKKIFFWTVVAVSFSGTVGAWSVPAALTSVGNVPLGTKSASFELKGPLYMGGTGAVFKVDSGQFVAGTTGNSGMKATIAGSVSATSYCNVDKSRCGTFPKNQDPANSFQTGAVIMFSGACPTGWTRFTTLDQKFISAAPFPLYTFGSNNETHQHTLSSPNPAAYGVLGGNTPNMQATGVTTANAGLPKYSNITFCIYNGG